MIAADPPDPTAAFNICTIPDIEIAEGIGLDAIGEHCEQQMLRQVNWCRATRHTLPSEAKGLEIKITQTRDLDLKRGRINGAA